MPARIHRLKDLARSTGLLAIVGVLVVSALAVAGSVVMHQLDPTHFGLWWGPHAFFFGEPGALRHVRQAQEDTLYLSATVIVALCGLVARELVGFARAGVTAQAR